MSAPDLCQTLREGLPALFECEQMPGGAVRVWTPFLYPDGDVIDVFVEQWGEDYILTDYGDTLGWLRSQSFRDKLTDSQSALIDDVCLTLGVSFKQGQLVLRCVEASALSEAVHRMGQAMIRVADIWFTFQLRAPKTIGAEVDDWLRKQRFDFEKSKQYEGPSGRVWKVDYEIMANARQSLVFLLSTSDSAWAKRQSERVFTACSDLQRRQKGLSFVSLFDDTDDVWGKEDIALVGSVSRTAVWSQRDEFASILAAEPLPLANA